MSFRKRQVTKVTSLLKLNIELFSSLMTTKYSNSVKYKLCKLFTIAIISCFLITFVAVAPLMILFSRDLKKICSDEL